MRGARRDVWARAQTGHLETWQGVARAGQSFELRRAFWSPIVRVSTAALPVKAGERVLDVGCGLDSVIDFVPEVSGFTLDSLMAQLSVLGLSPAAHHTAGLFESLPFADESFDRVFVMNVLDHVLDPEAGLREVARVVRPGGQLLLSVDTFEGWTFYEKRLHKWWKRVRGARTKHPWVFSRGSVAELMRRVGLEPSPAIQIEGQKRKRSFFIAQKPVHS